jgi:hypothetical protein
MAQTTAELIAHGKEVIEIPLTESERARFTECEQIVARGFHTFLEVGCALAEIRDNRLYREDYPGWTFEKYCKKIWDMGKSHAHRQVAAYRVVNLLESKWDQLASKSDESVLDKASPMGDFFQNSPKILPVNERQIRPLTQFKKDEDVCKAWFDGVVPQIQEDPKKKLTGALVNKAVREVKGEAKKERREEIKKEVDNTALVSALFKRQYNILMEIIVEEQNNRWRAMKKAAVLSHLKELIEIIEED